MLHASLRLRCAWRRLDPGNPSRGQSPDRAAVGLQRSLRQRLRRRRRLRFQRAQLRSEELILRAEVGGPCLNVGQLTAQQEQLPLLLLPRRRYLLQLRKAAIPRREGRGALALCAREPQLQRDDLLRLRMEGIFQILVARFEGCDPPCLAPKLFHLSGRSSRQRRRRVSERAERWCAAAAATR